MDQLVHLKIKNHSIDHKIHFRALIKRENKNTIVCYKKKHYDVSHFHYVYHDFKFYFSFSLKKIHFFTQILIRYDYDNIYK